MTSTTNTSTTSKTDHVAIAATFTSAFVSMATSDEISDQAKADLATAYQAIHTSKRATVQTAAFTAAMTDPKVNHDSLGAAVTVLTQASELADKTRAKVTVNPLDAIAEQRVILSIASAKLTSGLDDDGLEYVNGLFTLAVTDKAIHDGLAIKAEKLIASMTKPDAGERKVYKESLADLITRGDVKAGDKLVGNYGDYKATVQADGTVKIGAKAYGSLSKAGQEITGAKAINGWAFWGITRDDKHVSLGSMRQA